MSRTRSETVDAAFAVAGAVELRNEVSRAVQMELPGTLVFDYPTVAAIIAYISEKAAKAAAAAAPPQQQQDQVVTLRCAEWPLVRVPEYVYSTFSNCSPSCRASQASAAAVQLC